jgi:hypothetical protein
LAGIIALLCCLGFLLVSLPSSAASDDVPGSVPSASANGDGGPNNAPAPDANYPPTLGEEVHKTGTHPVNAPLLTTLMLTLSFGASVFLVATNDRRRRVASRSWGVEDRPWMAAIHEGPSFLGVFRL